jgi:O-antigen ligase
VLAFLLVVELATLSRSALLGLGVGLLVLLVPYRHRLLSRELLLPLAAVTGVLALVLAARWDFFVQVLRTRVDTSARGTSTHFDVYGFVPDVLASNPLFGLGLNNFSVYYEFVTGRTNFGPHSFYVATLVETGLVGTLLFAAFLVYVFRRLGRLREIGRALASPRIRPLAWGMTAALVGTIAANAFYLTMSFYYFFAFAMLALAAPIVFARRLA